MASDKFGSNPVAPLYNATGRNPRDVEMGTPGKALGSVGSSGAGGKDFGISNQPAKSTDLGASMFSPFNPYNMLYGRRGSGGGGEVEYDVDAMERIAKAQTPGVVQFGDANTGTINDYSQNKRAVNSKIAVTGDQNIANAQNQYLTNTATSNPATNPRQPRTPEQKAATAAKRAEKKEANPAYGKKNPNRPEKSESPITRKPKVAKTEQTRTSKSTGSIEMTQAMGNLKQKSTVGGNF